MSKPKRKLSGLSLHRFFRRFFRAQPELDRQLAETLASRATRTLTSVSLSRAARTSFTQQPRSRARDPAPAKNPAPQPDPVAVDTSEPVPAKPAGFDPYAFGLVPIYQREGRDGLLARLSEVKTAENLRRMARAQQIALPADLRKGDIGLDVLRDAIAKAVQKRIADRRAAAG